MLEVVFTFSTPVRNISIRNNGVHRTSLSKVASFNIPPTFSVRRGSPQGVAWNTNYKSLKLYVKNSCLDSANLLPFKTAY